MKNKIIFTSICFTLVIPGLVNGYNPTNEELRSSIFDYMGTQSRRQQTQDILDEQTRYNNQTLNSYYRQLDSIQAEGDFKLKQLQAEIDARERSEAWQKEKQLLDQQLQISNENKKLQEEINKLKAEEKTRKIIEEALDESGRITTPQTQETKESGGRILNALKQKEQIKNKTTTTQKIDSKPKSGSIFANFDSQIGSPVQPTITPQVTQNKPVILTVTEPKKNILRNIFDGFIGLFK